MSKELTPRERPKSSKRRKRSRSSRASHDSGTTPKKHAKRRSSSHSRPKKASSAAKRKDTRTANAKSSKRRESSASRTGESRPTRVPEQQPSRTSAATGYKPTVSKKSRQGRHYTPSHAAPQRRGFPVWGVLLVVVLVAGIGVGGFFLVQQLIHPYEGAKVEDGKEVTVVIPDGSSGADIVQILLDAGVIHSTSDFKKATQAQQADQSFKAGTYVLTTGMDPSEVVKQLVQGSNSSEGTLQIPEGLTLTQTAELVEQSLGIKKDDFIKQAKASNYAQDYSFLASAVNDSKEGFDSLEGFLYPKTYDFSGKDVTADLVIRAMLDQFSTEVQSLDLSAAEKALAERYNLNVTDYDILKIASIIEKEAITEEDRPLVSSVFYNRLSAGQALQSDATMGYVKNGNATAEDLKEDSAYNTYLHKGLPPTPICSPSLWAIEAAMKPADTKYLFFFIIDDGVYSNHTFSETYEEHQSAYEAALNEQKKANGQPVEESNTSNTSTESGE